MFSFSKSCGFLFLFTLSLHLLGGGFAIMEQSSRGLGQAFAGATTGLGDGSCIFYNPAALGRHEGRQFGLLASRIAPSMTFNDTGSSAIPDLGGFPLPGGSGGDGGDPAWVPNFYYLASWSPKLNYGFSINAPYGMASEYEEGWQGRYQALRSEMLTLNANLAFSYQASDRVSLGIGINYYKVDTELGNAIDLGSIAYSVLGPQVASQMGFQPMGTDGQVVVKGDGSALGFSLGFLYQPTDNTQVAFSFKPESKVELSGDADFTIPDLAQPLTMTGLFTDDQVTSEINFPQTLAFGVSHRTGRLEFALDILQVGWSSFEELRIKFDSGQPDAFVDESWEDSWRYALGFNCQYNPKVNIRMGVALDETPIMDAAHRTPRIPDNDRTWYSLGTTFSLTANTIFDISYAYVAGKDADIANSGGTDLLVGTYDLKAEVLSLGFTYRY